MPATNLTDAELLRDFVQNKSDAALRGLTERHVNLVFGTAFRRTGDHGAAEEIAQNVFMVLVRKAAWLQAEDSLASWLHRTAVMEARQWWRGEMRRRQREQTALELETTMKTSAQNDPALVGALDEALLELREPDRQVVLLRFFEGHNHREIGLALGIGEDAARKRVDKAMDQLMGFFRKRGFAVGSVGALVLVLTETSHAAPANLTSAILNTISTSGCAPATPFLGKILGLGRGKLAGLCVVTLLVPAVWQQARLVSARSEQQRLQAILKSLEAENSDLTNNLGKIGMQIGLAQRGRIRTNLVMSEVIGATNLDQRLFLWNDKVDYVRVPKSVITRIGFQSSLEKELEATLSHQGRVSPKLLGAMGLTIKQKSQVQDLVTQQVLAYRHWTEANGYMTEYAALDVSSLNAPATMKVNEDSRAWVIPTATDDGGSWHKEFHGALAAVIGEERATILLNKAKADGSLLTSLGDFASKGKMIIVTPSLQGGFYLHVTERNGQWSFNGPCAFSEALEPDDAEPFDEAAARKELTKEMQGFHEKFPNEEVPSMEDLIEASRKKWVTINNHKDKKHFNVLKGNLLGPLPSPLVEYLRQWREAHPNVPDRAEDQTHL